VGFNEQGRTKEEAMMERPVVEVEGLTIRYGRLTAVEGLSLAVPEGSVYALLGRNGSGKSSTVRCLLGQQRATAGRACLFGLDAWRYRSTIMTSVGVVAETPNVPPEMTADRLGPFLARVSRSWDREKYNSRLERFGVPRRTRFDRLSKGQKRQLSLTAAISTSPQLLILDDPTLGLDPVARRELFEELVSELADGGTSVFMTTHDLAGVEGIADRVGMIKDGHLLVDEGLEALKSRFRRLEFPSEEGSLGEAVAAEMRPLQSAAGGDGGVVVGGFDEGVLSRISQASPAAQVTAEPMSLEEIFVALCGENGGGK
jgi:ABC-2 type transport system ATP-binding protein